MLSSAAGKEPVCTATPEQTHTAAETLLNEIKAVRANFRDLNYLIFIHFI